MAWLAGVGPALQALARIEAGSTDPADFDTLGERWDIAQRLRAELDLHGLGQLAPERPAAMLSGGEAMRVALLGAWLSDADVLILDEPSNHLDRAKRLQLQLQLQRWPRGLLVVSHDRALLQDMQRIVELSSLGLRDDGGDYAFYAQCKAQQQQQALAELERCRHERRRRVAELRGLRLPYAPPARAALDLCIGGC